ncbi:MAG: hypothetical protein AAGC74_03595 [Verrucomicrobiota bacterium]
MEELQNLVEGYKSARVYMNKSTRGKNPDWYRPAIELSHQIHLLPSATGYEVHVFEKEQKKWSPEVQQIDTAISEEELQAFVTELRNKHLPNKARSLGVVLHLNQEASVFEFPIPEPDEAEELPLPPRDLIVVDPAAVLQDRTLGQLDLSFRIYPTPASPQVERVGCAVAMNRNGYELLKAFRSLGSELNFPIVTHAIATPYLLLSRLPRTFSDQEKPFCVMLRFDDFSFFGFFQETGELILLRSLKHNNRQLPQNLESVLRTTAAAVEIPDLDLKVFDCRREGEGRVEDHLQQLLYDFQFSVGTSGADESGLPIELRVFCVDDSDESLAFKQTETFGETLADKWHLQDFYEPGKEEKAELPTALDMKLMRIGRMVFRGGLAAALLLGLILGWGAFSKMRSPAWEHKTVTAGRAETLGQELKNVRTLESLLADRSKGWATMELFSRLFPLDGSVVFKQSEHKNTPEVSTNKRGEKAGFVRTWEIDGLAKESATGRLVKLNTPEGMAEVFGSVQEVTGNSSFDLSQKSRNLLVNMNLSENPTFNPDNAKSRDDLFPYRFKLEITQRIEAADDLAIPTSKVTL